MRLLQNLNFPPGMNKEKQWSNEKSPADDNHEKVRFQLNRGTKIFIFGHMFCGLRRLKFVGLFAAGKTDVLHEGEEVEDTFQNMKCKS